MVSDIKDLMFGNKKNFPLFNKVENNFTVKSSVQGIQQLPAGLTTSSLTVKSGPLGSKTVVLKQMPNQPLGSGKHLIKNMKETETISRLSDYLLNCLAILW